MHHRQNHASQDHAGRSPAAVFAPHSGGHALRRAIRRAIRALLLAAATAAPLIAAPAIAQAPATPAGSEQRHYDIPAGPVEQTLSAFARATGRIIAFTPALATGRHSPGLRGEATVEEGLTRLLAGSGLAWVRAEDGTYTLRPAPEDAALLAPVKVRAAEIDPATTEGSGTYAAKAITIGRTAQTLREIPQSVTVMTRQLIEDQNLDTVDDLMIKTPGITVAKDGSAYTGFWSRGFQIDNYQLDGVPITYESIFRPNQDLALYDRVEVLRGADGLFSGTGEAGGTINLVRKRPLESRQTLFSVSAGRWDNYRGELDVSSPLAFDGRLRGRAVVTYQDRDFFYSPSDEEKTLYYGIVSFDIAAGTVLSVGASHQRYEGVTWRSGLPRYGDGRSLRLSRSRALALDWGVRDNTTKEYFAELEHAFGGDWAVKVSAVRQEYDTEDYMAFVEGPVNPATHALGRIVGSYEETGNEAEAFNVHLAGSFDWLGLRHHVIVGGDWQDSTAKQMRFNLVQPGYGTPGSVFDFDPGAYPRPSVGSMSYGWPAYGAEQRGLYAKLQMHLLDTLQLVVGGRYSRYEYSSPFIDYDFPEESGETGYRESGIFTPYGGLIHDFADSWSAYLSVAEIHKSQASLLEGPPPGRPLDAITGRSYELGVKGELLDGRFNTALAFYRIEREGEAVDDPAYPYTPGDRGVSCCSLAQGNVVSEGVDTELAGELAPGWQVLLGYTYNRNENKTADAQYHAATPRHLFKAWTTYELPGAASAWSLGGGVTAQSEAANTGLVWVNQGAAGWAQVPFRVEQGGYSTWQARVGYRIDERWSLALNVRNVFDKVYYQTIGNNVYGNWYGEPRSYTLSLRGQF